MVVIVVVIRNVIRVLRNEGLSLLVGKVFWICVDALSCEECLELLYLAGTDIGRL